MPSYHPRGAKAPRIYFLHLAPQLKQGVSEIFIKVQEGQRPFKALDRMLKAKLKQEPWAGHYFSQRDAYGKLKGLVKLL